MRPVAEIAEAFSRAQETAKDFDYALKVSTPAVPYHAPYIPRPERAALGEATASVVHVRDLVGKFVI